MYERISFDYSGATVLVTGATSGIGHAIATAYRDAGASVVATGRKPNSGDYDSDLNGMDYRQLDIGNRQALFDLAASLERLDILVNNAGGS